MSKQWINSNGNYYYNDIPVVTDKLPKSVYELNFDGFTKQFFLIRISDKFELPEKVYGLETGLVDRIVTTFNRLDKNFGVLLKGLKGTGKTVVSKQVCNELGLPVILINKSFGDLGQFINSIEQDVVLFFDEFEKTYELSSYHDEDEDGGGMDKPGKKGVNHLLTVMDGVFTSQYKRLFLLTTNKVYLPDALISRPSRIRYVKEFSDLTYEQIIEILNDSVEDKKLIPDLAEILKGLEVITVDIVQSVAEEANIYGVATKEFFSIFNVSRDVERMDLVELIGEEEKMIMEDTTVKIDNYYVGSNFTLRKIGILGVIEEVDYENNMVFTKDNKGNKRRFAFRKATYIHKSMEKYAM